MYTWKQKHRVIDEGEQVSITSEGITVSQVVMDTLPANKVYLSWWEYGPEDDFAEFKDLHRKALDEG